MSSTGMDPTFQSELDRMFHDAPGQIGITSGWRSSSEQAQLYAKDPSLAAPPGSSWHEQGLAADLNFASPALLQWAHDHAADYGLFFPMGNEPWHVQPLWTQGRSAREGASAGDSYPNAGQPMGAPNSLASGGDPVTGAFGAMRSLMGMPSNVDALHPVDPFFKLSFKSGSAGGDTTNPDGTSGTPTQAGVGGAGPDATLTNGYSDAYQLIKEAGGTDAEARILAAIAGAESSYNAHAHADASTGMPSDDSWGLWQINMLGDMGPQRRQEFGISSNDELTDPLVNARAALTILHQQGFGAWSSYNSGAYQKYLS